MNLVNDYGKANEISQITPENHCNKELSFYHCYISIANNMSIWEKCLTFFYSSRCCFRCVFFALLVVLESNFDCNRMSSKYARGKHHQYEQKSNKILSMCVWYTNEILPN